MILRVVDIGGIDDHHSLKFLFIFTIICGGNNVLHVINNIIRTKTE